MGIAFEDPIQIVDGATVVGDFEYMSGSDTGEGQGFFGDSNANEYTAFGDAYEMFDTSRGGNDYLSGGENVYPGSYIPDGSGSSGGSGAGFDSSISDISFIGVSGGAVLVGDAAYMTGKTRGGNDTIIGGDGSQNTLVGDAMYMYGSARGGNDSITGGGTWDATAVNLIMGDAGELGSSSGPKSATESRSEDKVAAGSDLIHGGDATALETNASVGNFLLGDAYGIYAKSTAGADEIYGGNALGYGGVVPFSDVSAQDIVFPGLGSGAGALNFMAGDGYVLQGSAKGGNDEMYGGFSFSDGGDAYALNFMAGDGLMLADKAMAGNDYMSGGDAIGAEVIIDNDSMGAMTLNLMAGDSFGYAGGRLGNDTLVGGSASGGPSEEASTSDFMGGAVFNMLFGDIGDIESISGGPFEPVSNAFSGDVSVAVAFFGKLNYGNDKLTGGSGYVENVLVGDGAELGAYATGGKDTLEGGGWGSENTLYGDGIYLGDKARGGSDVLISGEGNDVMYGDAEFMGRTARGGADRFVFKPGNGMDTIEDFSVSQRDKIDLSAFKSSGAGADFRNFNALLNSGRMQDDDGGVYIYLDFKRLDVSAEYRGDSVFIAGVSIEDLTAASFIF